MMLHNNRLLILYLPFCFHFLLLGDFISIITITIAIAIARITEVYIISISLLVMILSEFIHYWYISISRVPFLYQVCFNNVVVAHRYMF